MDDPWRHVSKPVPDLSPKNRGSAPPPISADTVAGMRGPDALGWSANTFSGAFSGRTGMTAA